MIVGPPSLGQRLRAPLARPTGVAGLLEGQEAYQEFRRIAQELFPEDWQEIIDARDADGDRESARVWAFCQRVEARYFPVYEGDVRSVLPKPALC